MLSVLAAFMTVAAAAQSGLSASALDSLIERSARAITAVEGEIHGKELDRFTTAFGPVQAFETAYRQGQFLRRYVFLVRPKDPSIGPISFMLTSNAEVDQIARTRGHPAPLFLDQYSCNTHTTVAMLPRRPSYEELRALVVQTLEKPDGVSSTELPVTGACGFGAYVLPGLRPDR